MLTSRSSKKSLKRQRGANLVEHAMLLSLLALAGIPAVRAFGLKTATKMCQGAQATSSGTVSGVYYNPSGQGLSPGQGGCEANYGPGCPTGYRELYSSGGSYSCVPN